jgi:hypothetical protein
MAAGAGLDARATSTLDAPQITMALDRGISTAATKGLIQPAAAALTATIL